MQRPTTKQTILLIVSGVFYAWFWVWLLGLWAVYDTPLLKLGYSLGIGATVATGASSSIFAFLSAALCAVPLRLAVSRSLYISAVIFAATFLLVFIVPSIVNGEGISSFTLFTTVWLFILFFGLCIFLVGRLRRAAIA